MFTGIIETVGHVLEVVQEGETARLVIDVGPIVEGVGLGDSVAVNGCCLTVTKIERQRLHFDAVRETLERSGIGDLVAGSPVNLERAMGAGARLDGHIVQGHVDGTGKVDRLEQRGEDVQLFINCEAEFADLLVEKGSVAIDGVSLTVVGVRDAGFDVALIPLTLERTIFSSYVSGQRVNLEADVLGKYVKRYVEKILARS